MRPVSLFLSAFSFLAFLMVPASVAARMGEALSVGQEGFTVWWAPSTVSKTELLLASPDSRGEALRIQVAQNETEAAILVLRSDRPVRGLHFEVTELRGPGIARLTADQAEILGVKWLNLSRASDARSRAGSWPDPLVPLSEALDLQPGTNHVFWVRIKPQRAITPGTYRGAIRLRCSDAGWAPRELPVHLTVFDFSLPDRMSCVTAFGLSPGEVFRYHGLSSEEQKRVVLDKYLANLAAHHIAPYDPAPLDPIKVTWPDIKPPRTHWDDWTGLRIVTNEVHSGHGSLLVYDDQPGLNVTVTYDPMLPIPPQGFHFCGWFRTPVPGHRFIVTFNHFDSAKQWMSGRNLDLGFTGSGVWQEINQRINSFPTGAAYVRLHLRATTWTEAGEKLGLVWFDDLSLQDAGSGGELLAGGNFERVPRTKPVRPLEQLRASFDFSAWDTAMERAMNQHQFTSHKVNFPGLGGGTFHEIDGPNLLGFGEQDPEYDALMRSYGSQLEAHLKERGWLERGYVYWFDEPSPDQYPFVMNGFAKLKRYAPGLARMLTEQVEPGLIGGPNLWCPISNEYNHQRATERRAFGERFWWYVCTGPKAPYAGLFIDHPGPEMRLWVWQTWQHQIDGLLVWQINYWNSSAAYPDRAQPQNPYEDPMSWTSGYSTPAGERLPWGNGDGRFIYPPAAAASGNPTTPVLDGPVDSIRWEHLRDGIEDYEYFVILRDRLQRQKGKLTPERQAQLDDLLTVPASVSRTLTDFAADGTALEAHRRALAEAIQSLSPSK